MSIKLQEFTNFTNSIAIWFYFKIDLNSKIDKLYLIEYLKNTLAKYVKFEYCFIDNQKTNISDFSLDSLENYTSLIIDRDIYSDIYFKGEIHKKVEKLVTLYISREAGSQPDNSIAIIFDGNFFSYDHKYCTDEDVTKNLEMMRNILMPLFDNFEFIFSMDNKESCVYGANDTMRLLNSGWNLGIYTKGENNSSTPSPT